LKSKYLFAILLFISTHLLAQNKPLENSSQIELKTKSGSIFGTLLMPDDIKGKIPVALIIAGSGPTDRDGNNSMMKNNSLKLLAESLAKNGIASLRYDKRGVGESKQALKSELDISFQDYIQDADSLLALLKQYKQFYTFIIIGHSEGSLIGMNVAKNANGFISLAGAGNSADIILKDQLSAQGKQIQDMCFPIIDSLKAGKLVNNVNPMLNSLFRASVQPYMISWFKHNPQEDIKALKFPCLIIQGDNDLQISLNDAKLLAAAKTNNQLVIIEKMNHVLKLVEGGDRAANVAAYSNPDLPISAVLEEKVVKYIQSNK
jgi:pimeloyl-ACP methyl ester carboxylesterase